MRIDPRFSEMVLEQALARGVSGAEVYQGARRMLSAEARSGQGEAVVSASVHGYCLRVISGGRLGFSYSSDPQDVRRVVDVAVETARHVEDDGFLDLPGPSMPWSPEVFDPAVEALREEDAVESACLVEGAAYGVDARIKKTRKASASFYTNEMHVMNTMGLSYGYSSTYLSASILSVAEDAHESQSGWGYKGGRFLDDVRFDEVGADSARRAISLLGARRISASKAPVVLDSPVASSFLSVFSSMLSSEAVQKDKSLLGGRTGSMVVSPVLDVVDDGLMPKGPGSRPVDDEGVPVQKNVFIKDGVLRNLMYNTRTARKDSVSSTGNAVRAGFKSLPSVGPVNLYADSSADKLSMEGLLGKAEEGLLVTEAMGIHTANPVSGEFSIGVSGLWIKGGRAAYPVKEAVISGNLLEFFSRVLCVGDDLGFFGCIGSPSLLFGPTDISA